MEIVKLIWIGLPAGMANTFCGLSANLLPKFNYPLDFYKTFRGKRIFGDHKTFRGILFGAVFGLLTFYIQRYFYLKYEDVRNISIIDYQNVTPLFGAATGVISLMGDAIKSFAKRQLNKEPGAPWFPFDQIDWVVSTGIFLLLLNLINVSETILAVLVGLVLHLLFKAFGYIIGINETPI